MSALHDIRMAVLWQYLMSKRIVSKVNTKQMTYDDEIKEMLSEQTVELMYTETRSAHTLVNSEIPWSQYLLKIHLFE